MEAQVAINANGASPSPSSILDVSSTSKGMLMPRMTTTQRKAVANPEMGLLVFDIDRQTIYLFDGQKWKPMMTATESTAPLVSREPNGANDNAGFGRAADIYDNFVVVGAPTDSAKGITGGAAYIFEKENGNWKQRAKISAPNPQDGENFGSAVSITNDLVVVGSPKRTVGGQAQGAVYVFKRIGRVWNYVAMLTASNGAVDDQFGTSVCNSSSFIAVGAPYRDQNGIGDAGSVYIFGLQNSVWSQKAFINATDPAAYAKFGFSIDLFEGKLIVGSPAAPASYFGTPTNGGAAYLFNNTDANGFTWSFEKKFAPAQTHDKMEFGKSVAIENNKIACGAPAYSGIPGKYYSNGGGAVFTYELKNGNWAGTGPFLALESDAASGASVAWSNGFVLAGMPGWSNNRGRVFIYSDPYRYAYDEDPNLQRNFGGVVAAHNGQFVVTSPLYSSYGRIFFGVVE